MNKGIKLSWKAWAAVLSIVLFYVWMAVSGGDWIGTLLYGVVGFCVAGVAAFDSTQVHLRRYRTGLSYGPIGLFMICALFWPVVIVWYFVVRIRIARGTMPLRG